MKILKINSSANKETSVTRKYVDVITNKLTAKYADAVVTNRDIAYDNLPFVNQDMLGGYFAQEALTPEQVEATATSTKLTQELIATDVIVLGAPIYNFTVPASFKAYIDLVSRAGLTFKYSEQGLPIGLLNNKKIYVVIASGGIAVGSDYDFCGSYIKHIFAFLGLTDVTIIAADELMMGAEAKLQKVEATIENLDL